MVKHLCILSTSLCNLNCKYCYLSKNDAMKALDKQIEASFLDKDYYWDLILNCDPDICNTLKRLDVWGGEPFLYMTRTLPFIETLIQNCPSFNEIWISSNYANNKLISELQNLINLLHKYQNRSFRLRTQISCDGPEDINDYNRGEGTTKSIINNLNKLLDNNYFLKDINENITVEISLKPTLSKDHLAKFLDKDYNIRYFKFFEDNFITPIKEKNHKNIKSPSGAHPNFVVPCNYSQQDGKILAEVVKLQSLIEKENKTEKFFKYHNSIVFFKRYRQKNYKYIENFECNGKACGTMRESLTVLPNGTLCGCHRLFAEFFDDYIQKFNEGNHILTTSKPEALNAFIFKNPNEYFKHKNKIQLYSNDKNSTFLLSSQINSLMSLAKSGLVDKKYENIDIALKALKIYHANYTGCILNNMIETKTIQNDSNSHYKFFFNGAIDYIFEEYFKKEKDNNDNLLDGTK